MASYIFYGYRMVDSMDISAVEIHFEYGSSDCCERRIVIEPFMEIRVAEHVFHDIGPAFPLFQAEIDLNVFVCRLRSHFTDLDGGFFSETGDASIRPEDGGGRIKRSDFIPRKDRCLIIFFDRDGLFLSEDQGFPFRREHIRIYFLGYDRRAFGEIGKQKESDDGKEPEHGKGYRMFLKKSFWDF